MSKAHRGSGIRSMPSHGRGTCPRCKATGIKLLYEHENGDQEVMLCKFCHAALKNGKSF